MDINNIVFREDLYPRFEPSQSTIQKYADSIEQLPPIEINQNNILIDGFHRWKAHLLAEQKEIDAKIIETDSEKHLKQLACQKNSHHGLQLKNSEKKRFAQEMYGQIDNGVLSNILSVSEHTISRWTTSQAKAAKEDRNRRIVDLYLRAWNSQESIADILGVDQSLISRIVSDMQKRHLSNFHNDFQPFLYNIWKQKTQDNQRKHFGAFPEEFMKNLLHYHTEPLDIVYDPFAGGGTTADMCKKMFRRYYCSDRKVVPGREKDIREHDIKDGLPDDLPKPELVFFDPPYWKQAENQYSQDNNDLGNMTLEEFNNSMQQLFAEISDRGVQRIALVIQPTQYKNDFNWQDHVFDFDKMLPDYSIEMRYILPYSTQQYTPQCVTKAKEKKKCLCLNRDLIIWKME